MCEGIYSWSTSGSQRNGSSDCLLKTQDYANSKENVYGPTLAQCWKVKGRCQFSARGAKRQAKAPVNGGRNYNGGSAA